MGERAGWRRNPDYLITTHMKRIVYIIIMLLPFLCGCTMEDSSSAVEKFDKYIFFSQGVETKASLIEKKEDLNGQTFGIVGFKYPSTTDWETFIEQTPAPTPNLFYDGNGSLVETETLTCSADGSASYAPLQGWSNTKKYSFFAYYPYTNENVNLVNLDGNPYTGGVPAIKYTMNEASLASSMVDIMTAPAQTDKYWISSTNNNINNSDVKFLFSHCLSSLGLNAKNSSAGDIILKNVILVVDGIKYSSAIIPLDGTPEQYTGPESSIIEGFPLDLTDSEKSVVATSKELADKLIFIPQTDNVSISLTINYQRKYGDNDPTDDSFSTTTPLTTTLTKGKKHIIYVNFNDSNTYVMVKTDNWDAGPNVPHEFN